MKNRIVALGVAVYGIFFLTPNVWACYRNFNNFICPGDPAITEGGNQGHVLAVNPYRRVVTIKIEAGSPFYIGQNATQSVEKISIGVGCVLGYCVGDKAVTQGENQGTIVGVNPYQHTVSIKIESGSPFYLGQIATQSVAVVGIGFGCLQGYCVGDAAITEGGNQGHIVAINPYTQKVTIKIEAGSPFYIGQMATQSIDVISVSNYCIQYGDDARSVRGIAMAPRFDYSYQRPERLDVYGIGIQQGLRN